MLVYCCRNRVNGKVYVGKTSHPLGRRWSDHKTSARRGSPHLFHRAIRKYGPEAFEITVVATAGSEEELNTLEIHHIQAMDSLAPGGYNLRAGGEGGPHSPETIAKLREQAVGRTVPRRGEASFTGRHHTEETKAFLRERCGQPGRVLTSEHKNRIATALTGKSKAPEAVEKMRLSKVGVPDSEEHKQKVSATLKGRPKPEGFGVKLSAAQKGRPKSEAHRQALREAAQRRAAQKRGEL